MLTLQTECLLCHNHRKTPGSNDAWEKFQLFVNGNKILNRLIYMSSLLQRIKQNRLATYLHLQTSKRRIN